MVTLLEAIWAPKSLKGGRKCHHALDMCFAIPFGSLPGFPAGGGGPVMGSSGGPVGRITGGAERTSHACDPFGVGGF